MGDEAIALAVLLKYAGFGITPLVIPPMTGAVSLPTERIPQQNATDKQYLNSVPPNTATSFRPTWNGSHA